MTNEDTSTSKKQSCPYFPDIMENRKLCQELVRERKRRETAEMDSRMSLLFGFIAGAFSVGIIVFLIMRSGMERETAEAFARLFATWTTLFFAFVILLQITNSIISCIIRWHNERKKQNTNNKQEDGKNA